VLNALILQEAADGIAEAFVGGTVGVMSVALYLELKKLNEKNLEACPYCVGNGEILCGSCLGSGITSVNSSCSICGGRGLVMCINCKGDGRETPILLVSKAVRNPVS
jgi:RecJ-like exonuclease